MDFDIRQAQTSDIPSLKKLFTETIMNVCNADYNPLQLSTWTSSTQNLKRWEDAVANQYFVLAVKHDELLGFASLENGQYVDFLYINKHYQGKGIAAALLAALEREACNSKTKTLHADVSVTAKPFFIKKGFQVTREETKWMNGVSFPNCKMHKSL